jgi:hypothetical protein
MHQRRFFALWGFLFVLLAGGTAMGQAGAEREWTDSTGRFRVTARLMEVKDGVVFLQSADGKTFKVPLERLSQADQNFLKASDNPFEIVEEGRGMSSAARPESASPGARSARSPSTSGYDWNHPWTIDWNTVPNMDPGTGGAWQSLPPFQQQLGFTPQQAVLGKKVSIHEQVHPVQVNPTFKRAVIGYTITFGVPKKMSRFTLVDLESGRTVDSVQVEAMMRPLALLNDGQTVLMVGSSDEREGMERPYELQLWRIQGAELARSASWIPFANEAESRSFGRRETTHANVTKAVPLAGSQMMLLSERGHLAVLDATTRKPVWHAELSGQVAVDVTTDRSLMAVMQDAKIMIMHAATGKVHTQAEIPDKPHIAWPRIGWSPSGKHLVVSYLNHLRVFNVESGQWVQHHTQPGPPLAPHGLDFPHEDFVLLNNNRLLHMPTKIHVCDYHGAQSLGTVGGTTFVCVQEPGSGSLRALELPHAKAMELLERAQKDPGTFLLAPGASVAIDVSKVPAQHQPEARSGLEEALGEAGFRVAASAQVSAVAKIEGPTEDTVSFIARGSYKFNKYVSHLSLVWQGNELWSTSWTNVPGVLTTQGDETIEQALQKLGQAPNLTMFRRVGLPQFVQRPRAGADAQKSTALMVSRFTLQGVTDQP